MIDDVFEEIRGEALSDREERFNKLAQSFDNDYSFDEADLSEQSAQPTYGEELSDAANILSNESMMAEDGINQSGPETQPANMQGMPIPVFPNMDTLAQQAAMASVQANQMAQQMQQPGFDPYGGGQNVP